MVFPPVRLPRITLASGFANKKHNKNPVTTKGQIANCPHDSASIVHNYYTQINNKAIVDYDEPESIIIII